MATKTLFSYFNKVPNKEKLQSKSKQPILPSHATNGTDLESNADGAEKATKSSKPSRPSTTVKQKTEQNLHDVDNEVDKNGMDCDVDEETDNSKENSPGNRNFVTKSGRKPKLKRRRVIESESEDADSEDDYKPVNEAVSSSSEESSDESSSEMESESEPDSPVKSLKRKRPTPSSAKGEKKEILKEFSSPSSSSGRVASPSVSFTPTVGSKTKSKLAAFSAPDTPVSAAQPDEDRVFPHLTLDFIQPDRIKDADKHSKDHPDYDPSTLFVPESFLNKQTPAMRQWWVIKSKHYDQVLFFKMGKFYELFHMDAAVGVTELGLIYMKGDHAHAGFPEIAFGRYSESLIQKGYKIARIEQTETPDMMQERCRSMNRSATKFDKVVKREVCSVQTCATRRYSFIDGDSCSSNNSYLLAVCERPHLTSGDGTCFGVCFIDTTIGVFHLGQFEDDRHCSRFTTLISHFPPAQVLQERGKLSEKCSSILTNRLKCMRESLKAGTQFWDGSQTLKFLMEGNYFSNDKKGGSESPWPETLKSMASTSDSLGLTPAEESELSLSALGAVVWYLKEGLMEEELLSMRRFEVYKPLDEQQENVQSEMLNVKHMVLDGVTLCNLDVVTNSSGGGSAGTLLQQLDRCHTPFGKRLFKQWLCAPLCNPDSINDRLDAVDDLNGCLATVAEVSELMRKLPDLDRLLSKIHALGSARRSKEHPDSRAIFFEEVTYSKRKIEDFLSALEGFQLAMDIAEKFKSHVKGFKSMLLHKSVCIKSDSSNGLFPDLSEQIQFFERAFDHRKAKAEGVIKPSKGVDADYDQAMKDIHSITQQLDDYLAKQKNRLGCKNLTYWGSGKNRFQMEVPDAVAKNVPHEYEMTSSKKGYKRYRTHEIERLLGELSQAEDDRDAALKDGMRRVFHQFDTHYDSWSDATQCLSVLDVLMSLAEYSRCGDGAMCRPVICPPTTQPFIKIRVGRHPCISQTFSGEFIPNDTVIGINHSDDLEEGDHTSRLVLVTGPNMGGKSTLMRQVGCIVIMAHLGCYVPAEQCEMTPVDRVFTRLGATDRIMAGESTFFMELSETSAILQHATKHSLVLLDELGRGTATYDGTAIACGVVQELSQNISCRTLFSTHYHSLVEEFSHDSNISLGHMACMVENENEENPGEETITFLYKFAPGACPKSYGFNAARLANIPEQVIKKAIEKAKEFEAAGDRVRLFRSLYNISAHDYSQAAQVLKSLA